MTDRINYADAPVEAITSKVFQTAHQNWTWEVRFPGGGSIHPNRRTFSSERESRDDADRAICAWLTNRIRNNREAEAKRIKAAEANYICQNSERVDEKTHSVGWFIGKPCQWCGVSRFEKAA